MTHVQRTNVGIGLPHTHKHHGLASGVNHGHRGAHLVVDGVELGQHNAVNLPRLVDAVGGVLDESLIETLQLVHAVVTNKSLANKQHLVGPDGVDEFCKRLHEGQVVLRQNVTLAEIATKHQAYLHTSGCVDENDVNVFFARVLDCLLRYLMQKRGYYVVQWL